MRNPLIIEKAKEVYIKHNGQNHREIEREMREAGCLTFSRRVLYNQGKRLGWVAKYEWKRELLKQDEQDTQDNDRQMIAKVSDHTPLSNKPDPVYPVHPVKGSAHQPPTASCQVPTDFKAWLKAIAPTMTWDWKYQQLIYEKLNDVTTGKTKRLMIFLPPRHGKSELVTVRYSAWRLRQDPKLNIILGSYNQRLANRFSRKVRITWEDAFQIENGQLKMENETASKAPFSNSQLSIINSPLPAGDSTDRSQEGGRAPAVFPTSQLSIINSQLPSLRRRLNTVSEWETGMGGGVRAVGVGGGITGFGADLIIIDDPVRSRAEAESKTYRDKTYEWFCDDLYTRLEPNASIILIQTRWHEDDLAGRLLKDSEEEGAEQWEVISLPALAEAGKSYAFTREDYDDDDSEPKEPELLSEDGTVIPPPVPPVSSRLYYNRDEWKEYDLSLAEYKRLLGEQQTRKGEEEKQRREEQAKDPKPVDILGRFEGMPLCPERFSRDDLLRIKRKLGTYSFSALYQQRPTPPEGGLFKRKWFSRIVDRAPDDLRWVRAYDLAISTRDNADYTASFRCALDRRTGELYIADGFRKRMEFPEQKQFIFQRMMLERNTEHGIEEALHGLAFIQELRRDPRLFGRAFRGIRVTTDKFTRALSWANLAEEGKVILVRGSSLNRSFHAAAGSCSSNWIEDFLDEVCSFPNSPHDDQIDAVSLAVQMLEKRKHIAIGF
jgi:predicted phage terminase large subunit-like protein